MSHPFNNVCLSLSIFTAAGKFAVPDYLNKQVVDLIVKMLLVDPLKRATVTDIRYGA